MFTGSSAVVATRAKCFLIVAVVGWAACATTWLVALSAQEHCPMARTTRVLTKLNMSNSLQFTLNVRTSEISTLSTSTLYQSVPTSTVQSSKENILRYYSSLLYDGGVSEGCTMVMLTYRRQKLLPRILRHYCQVVSLKKILVVWNDVGTAVPQALLNLTKECAVKLQFVLSEENKLTNRYLPRSEIETDCKFRESVLHAQG